VSAVAIRTDRLWLGPFAGDDVDGLHALFGRPEVRRYLLDDRVVPRAWVEEVVASSEASFAAHGWGLWTVALAPDGGPIGFTGYREFHEPPVVELIWGLESGHHGRGLAREASQAALRHGFETLGFDPIRATVDAPNEPSLGLARRLGFEEVGRERGPAYRWEQVHFALPRARFERGAGRFETS
jgi:ribosomal-protein-alanine N-acetyltransferase